MNPSRFSSRSGSLIVVGFFLAVPALTLPGCGAKKGNPGVVKGKVVYNGKDVTGGKITFHPTDGSPDYPGTIKSDGTFELGGVPEGSHKVTIDTEYLRNNKPEGSADPTKMPGYDPKKMKDKAPVTLSPSDAAPPLYVKIPEKYAKLATTPLTIEVTKGENQKDFELNNDK